MISSGNRSIAKLSVIFAILLLLSGVLLGQTQATKKVPMRRTSIDERLAQKATFIPKSESALEQLIEVARHYQIPMGIEWINRAETNALAVASGANVGELIQAILQRSPEHQATVENDILHISPVLLSASPRNVLNLRIEEFYAKNENVFEVNDRLKTEIRDKFNPEKYANGYNCGFGYAPDDALAVRNITFSGSNLTVREILDGIVRASGNAIWIVNLKEENLVQAEKPPTQEESKSNNQSMPMLYWRFIPLKGTF